jgi:hypothetical protein
MDRDYLEEIEADIDRRMRALPALAEQAKKALEHGPVRTKGWGWLCYLGFHQLEPYKSTYDWGIGALMVCKRSGGCNRVSTWPIMTRFFWWV